MKKVKKWRYYCEYCKKSGASAYHIQRHEESCTMNPHRVCKMCHADPDAEMVQKPMEDLISALLCHGADYEKGLMVLRDATDNCPACILSAIRQSGIQRAPMPTGDTYMDCGTEQPVYDDGVYLSFHFKTEQDAFWADINEARAEQGEVYF